MGRDPKVRTSERSIRGTNEPEVYNILFCFILPRGARRGRGACGGSCFWNRFVKPSQSSHTFTIRCPPCARFRHIPQAVQETFRGRALALGLACFSLKLGQRRARRGRDGHTVDRAGRASRGGVETFRVRARARRGERVLGGVGGGRVAGRGRGGGGCVGGGAARARAAVRRRRAGARGGDTRLSRLEDRTQGVVVDFFSATRGRQHEPQGGDELEGEIHGEIVEHEA